MSYRRLIFYLITIAAIILVYLKFSELQLIQQFFHQSNWRYLAAILAIQFCNYFFQAVNYRAVLRIKGLSVGVWELFPISFVVQFISQAVPTAGISGQIFFISYLKKYSLTLAEGIGRAILEVATLYVAYIAYFLISLILVFRSGIASREPRIEYFIYGVIAFSAVIITIFLLSQKRKKGQPSHWLIERLVRLIKRNSFINTHFEMVKGQFQQTLSMANLRRNKTLFMLACFWQLVILLTHVLTLYVVAIAIGHPIAFAACFIAFTFSKFLSMISVVPGAPGIFEGAMTLILIAFGVDKSVALAATLLMRAFTFWLAMPIGWILYSRYSKELSVIDDKPAVS